MPKNPFFDEQREQSRVKTLIVTKYFNAWSNVMLSSQSDSIHYLDLYTGPGLYVDGSKSTPIEILEIAIHNDKLCERLVTTFVEADVSHAISLQKAINELPFIDRLQHPPIVSNRAVNQELALLFQAESMLPTLSFIDPWGYKGLSLSLLNSVIKDWGSDCIFFFNYNRITAALDNPVVEPLINDLFGTQRAENLRAKCLNRKSHEREYLIIEEMCEAIRKTIITKNSPNGESYVLPFTFKDENGAKTSHHLIFVSKHVKGYTIMKGIMASQSSSHEQGVASFQYNMATAREPFLYNLLQPRTELGESLLQAFAGLTLTMKEIFDKHQVNTPFVSGNYKDALNELEVANKISALPAANKRPLSNGKRSFADRVKVTFPKRSTPER